MQLLQVVGREARLVTICGPAGIGKTRLTLELLHSLEETHARRFPGGVHFISLADATTLVELCQQVRVALGFAGDSPTAQESLHELGYALSGRGSVLLVLDNVEQVVEPAAEALEVWLGEAEQATFVLTSRERLRLEGEVVIEVPPLSLVGGGSSEAVRLFVERAAPTFPGFEPDDEDLEIIADVADRLDGLPLAIELAAARSSVLTPHQILERLDHRFELLVRGPRSLAARHQTLRRAIDWSWRLLTAEEQSSLAQLTVFKGGFDIEAAEDVIDAVPAGAVLGILEALRDKSLLTVTTGGTNFRWTLLESICVYAEERLQKDGNEAEARDRHADYFARHGRLWARQAERSEDAMALRQLSVERANLLAAVDWSLRSPTPKSLERTLRALLALDPVFVHQGPAQSQRNLLDAAIGSDRFDDVDVRLRAESLSSRGHASKRLGAGEESVADYRCALAFARESDLRDLEVEALAGLGTLRYIQGHLDEALDLHTRALELVTAVDIDVQHLEARVNCELATALHVRGELDAAREHYVEALSLFRRLGNQGGRGRTLARLGFLHQDQGDLDEASRCYQEARSIHRDLDNRSAEATVLGFIGNLERQRRRFDRALRSYEEAIAGLRLAGDRDYQAVFLMDVGILMVDHQRWQSAEAQLLEALDLFEGAPNSRCEALALGYMAITSAHCDRWVEAERWLERANVLITDPGNPVVTVLKLHAAHIAVVHSVNESEPIASAQSMLEALEASTEGTSTRSQHVELAARILQHTLHQVSPPQGALVISDDGAFLAPPFMGGIPLTTRMPLRRLLLSLARARLDRPGEPISAGELITIGWPDEHIAAQAAKNRLRVGLTSLRRLGLKDCLIHESGGYMIASSQVLVIIPEGAISRFNR